MQLRTIISGGAIIALAVICTGQSTSPGTSSQGPVYNMGPHEPVAAIGPFSGGTRLVRPADDDHDEDEEEGARPPRTIIYPPATPEMAGPSFLDALRQLDPSGAVLQGGWQESIYGALGGGTATVRPGPHAPKAPLPRSNALTTQWVTTGKMSTSNDPQVASSSWAVGVLSWDQLAFFDKAGTLLPSTPNFPNPTNTETVFAPLVQWLDQSVINLNPQVVGNPDFMFGGPSGQVGDARIEFDTYRKRWVILGTAKNPAPSAKYPLALRASQRRTMFLLAVSNDEDPSHGFTTWAFAATPNDGACTKIDDSSPCPNSAFTPGNAGDYPSIGISSMHYVLTDHVGHAPLDGSKGSDVFAYMVTVNAQSIAKGDPNIHAHAFWNWDIGKGEHANGISQPVVSRTPMNPDWGLVTKTTSNRLIVTGVSLADPPSLVSVWWDIPNITAPVDWTQLGSPQKITYWNVVYNVVKATQTNGMLTLAFTDCRNWNVVPKGCVSSIHLISANVNLFPNFCLKQKDRVFGLRSALDDDPTDVVAYAIPGVTMNKDGDIAVVYNRTSPKMYDEARYSTWLHGEPDIRPSAVLQAGLAPIGCVKVNPCDGQYTFDTAGIGLDPFDQTGVWMAHMYAIGGGTSFAVGKVFGRQYPGLMVANVVPAPTTIHAGQTMTITYDLANYGDAAAANPYVPVTMESLTGSVALSKVIGVDVPPPMAPGSRLPGRTVTVTIPAGTPSGVYRIRLDGKVMADVAQYTEGANFAYAQQFVTVQ